jgi:2-polyprenyl-3-methyl-5-hydroxy-6-metoxy-1,4-benzoquinol methylase
VKAREMTQFDFGANWKAFSERELTRTHVDQAKQHFSQLFSGIELRGRAFLDIGFGQGLTLLIATLQGANTVGCEISPTCAAVLHDNQKRYFSELSERTIPIVLGSILDQSIVELLQMKSPDQMNRAYQVVHSWGVLHHTGDMRRAIQNAASLVAPQGFLVIAIYASHWSSGAWRMIKRLYNRSPMFVRRILIALFTPVIFMAKWIVTQRDPMEQTRGMSFYYNIIDWLGGYPYEYATAEDVCGDVNQLGFELVRVIRAIVPTGCNEFIFKRVA